MTSISKLNRLISLCFAFQLLFINHASASSLNLLSSNSYGPVERDCNHSRITCIEGNQTIFAVKGPLTLSQANQLCPSTPKQTAFKWNRLPSNIFHPIIIVNAGSDIIAYSQQLHRIQKTSNETLPNFSFILCGTSDHKPNSGLHKNADKSVPFDTFLDNSFSAEQIKNPPTDRNFKASDRTFAFREVALGDSLAYIRELFPSSEVNYKIAGTYITGYHLHSFYSDIVGKFDKDESLYEFTASFKEKDTTLSAILQELLKLYGMPVTKGDSSLDHDLDINNDVKSGTYIWKISVSAYLTVSIETTADISITVKMVDINKAEKATEYFNKVKKIR